ncbi:hypothetical protein PPACK8108_LOCUS15161 [Phakopsora pachyrhizi]|uniref:Uncharacterized protein n=1 Tax=Phakopsora pachyrhizi TaxID=170000 RepID=A0AAV0B9E5_PHAPC|nr:hypothetical protein PPACK8108_LOCUS10276 [Phakopsora pachyrhizi]CAH7682313.1 hypothetical protein PPACK8108_LOCUS15161 [Phakopsora pachyrhizi]
MITWRASDYYKGVQRWADRNDEAHVRDYKIREANRASRQDKEDAYAEYRTRQRRKEHEHDFNLASQAVSRLNMDPLLPQSSSARYQTKAEAQAAQNAALESEARFKSLNRDLEDNLRREQGVSSSLSLVNNALAAEAAKAQSKAAELLRLKEIQEGICNRDRLIANSLIMNQERRIMEQQERLERLRLRVTLNEISRRAILRDSRDW